MTNIIPATQSVSCKQDWCAADYLVRTFHGVIYPVEAAIEHTLENMHEIPDGVLFAKDNIIEEMPGGFALGSGQVNLDASGRGCLWSPAKRSVNMVAISECFCRNIQVMEVWLLRDQGALFRQLGLDPVVLGKTPGKEHPETHVVGDKAMRQPREARDGFALEGDSVIRNQFLDLSESIQNGKNSLSLEDEFDGGARLEGSAGLNDDGRAQMAGVFLGILASFSDCRFDPHLVIVPQQPAAAARRAL